MDKNENIVLDWNCYDRDAVDNEIKNRKASNAKDTEFESLSRDMFVEYVRWLHDQKPELFYIMSKMYEADGNGNTEELEKWKRGWDSYSQG